MGHHAEHVALTVDDPRDIPQRSIARRSIAEQDAIFSLEFIERPFIRIVIAFAVGDRNPQDLSSLSRVCEWTIGSFNRELHELTDEFQPLVSHQRARQHSAFDQDLKAVADAEDESAACSETL